MAATSPTRCRRVRAVRAADALRPRCRSDHKLANQHLLSRLLRRKAEMLEMPVQFFPISPERVKRTTARSTGCRRSATIVWRRFDAAPRRAGVSRADVSLAGSGSRPAPRAAARNATRLLIVPGRRASGRAWAPASRRSLVPVAAADARSVLDLYRHPSIASSWSLHPSFARRRAAARRSAAGLPRRRASSRRADRDARRDPARRRRAVDAIGARRACGSPGATRSRVHPRDDRSGLARADERTSRPRS